MHFWYMLDDHDQPVAVDGGDAWGHFMLHDSRRVIARTTVGDAEVCTDFVGFNQAVGSAFSEGPPVLWETMVFRRGQSEDYERYTSRDDALAGHAAMVAKLTNP